MDKCPKLYAFAHDAKRFALNNRSVIEQAPLQVYCSALLFAPEESIVRRQFDKCIPAWIQSKPKVKAYWDAELQTLEAKCHVSSVAFSHDSKLLASNSVDSTVVCIWDAKIGSVKQILQGHTSSVQSVAFSHDSKFLASGSYDKMVYIWNTIDWKLYKILSGNGVYTVAFSPDSKFLASGSDGGAVHIWDAENNWSLQQSLEGHKGEVKSVAFSHDSTRLASGSVDRTMRIWIWDAVSDAGKWTLERELDTTSDVFSVAFSHNSTRLASGSLDKIVRIWIWDAGDWKLDESFKINKFPEALSFDPSGCYLSTARGCIALNEPSRCVQSEAKVPRICGYGLSEDNSWITWNGNNALWLPPDYRPLVSAISSSTSSSTSLSAGSMVALGCLSGRVLSIGFSGWGPCPLSKFRQL